MLSRRTARSRRRRLARLVALGIALQPGGPDSGPSLDAQLLAIGRDLDPGSTPRPGDEERALTNAETLQQRLGELERDLAELPDDPERLAQFASPTSTSAACNSLLRRQRPRCCSRTRRPNSARR